MRLTKSFSARASLGLALGVVMLLGAAPARAADDEPGFDEKIVDSRRMARLGSITRNAHRSLFRPAASCRRRKIPMR